MREVLSNAGWILTQKCNCGGVRREEYQHSERAGVIIKLYPTKFKFRISKAGRKLKDGSIGELENAINGLT